MVRNTALALLSLGCLFASPATAQDDLLCKCTAAIPADPDNSARAARQRGDLPRRSNSGRCYISIRGCPRATPSAAIPAITSGSAAPMPSPPPSAIAGSMADAMLPRFSMRCSTRRSSGTAGPKTSNSRPVGRWSIRSRWHHPRAHVAEQLKGIPGYRDAVRQGFPGRAGPDHAWQCAKGHRRVRGDADHAQRAVRPLSQGRAERAFADAESRA